jgi:putative restriction endonuclease
VERINNWTREQIILALFLYCQTPFGQIHAGNKQIIEMAGLIGRTPAALSMKMCNFARFDPELRRRGVFGLPNGSHLDEEIWKEFSSDFSLLSYEATAILSTLKKQAIESFVDKAVLSEIPLGDTRSITVRARINQTFFRRALLSSFNSTCCVTKIQVPNLLIASHIKPWRVCNDAEKTNPRNGLLLNAFHDKAFDLGYITISTEFEIIISPQVETYFDNRFCHEWLKSLSGRKIERPDKFLPSSEFIEYHNDVVFLK